MNRLMAYLGTTLKYLPAAVLGLLVIAWGASVYFVVGSRFSSATADYELFLSNGSLQVACDSPPIYLGYLYYKRNQRVRYPQDVVGRFWFRYDRPAGDLALSFAFPMLTAVTLMLPLAIGSLTGFRFRLWQCLAFSSLVAIQLAFQSQQQRFPFEPNEIGSILPFLVALAIAVVYLGRRFTKHHREGNT